MAYSRFYKFYKISHLVLWGDLPLSTKLDFSKKVTIIIFCNVLSGIRPNDTVVKNLNLVSSCKHILVFLEQ